MSDDADDPQAARRTPGAHGAVAGAAAGTPRGSLAPRGPLAPPGPLAPGCGLRPAGYPEGRIPAVPGPRTRCRVLPSFPAAPGTAPRRVHGRPAAVGARGGIEAPHPVGPARPAAGAARRTAPGRARTGGTFRTAATGERAPRPRVPAADGAGRACAAPPPAPCARAAAVTARAGVIRPERRRPAGAFGLVTEDADPLRDSAAPPLRGSPPPCARDRTGRVAHSRGRSRGRGGRPPVASGAAGSVPRAASGDAPYGHGRRPSRHPQAGISEARGVITVGPDRAPEHRPTAPSRTPTHGLSHRPGTHRPAR
ncbi:hypothetical protein [Streptomyces erythrochromogenes]|uniref:hypothetical protein n=1 Tax=Streptomyces erythrochromogenes TaxID=285574 RepID=UPI00381DDBB5